MKELVDRCQRLLDTRGEDTWEPNDITKDMKPVRRFEHRGISVSRRYDFNNKGRLIVRARLPGIPGLPVRVYDSDKHYLYEPDTHSISTFVLPALRELMVLDDLANA